MDRLRVLIVDDEVGIRLAIARALLNHVVPLPEFHAEFGFDTEQAGTGEEALEAIGRKAPDIVLLDHKLPGMSGLEVLEQLRKRGDDLLVVMITAYASLDTAVTATRRGAYDFLAKPFTPDELKSALFKAAKHLVVQRQARRLADERRRVRFEFLSVVAHELKAPLAAIEGYLMMMQEKSLGGDLGAYEQVVGRTRFRLDGMRKLIADLMDLTRIESGQKRRDVADVDLRGLGAMCVESASASGRERGVTVELAPGGPVRMQVDAGEIELILNNLLSNAVKYNRDGGRVDLSIEAAGGGAMLTVRDSGIGMTPAETARLFGEFVRIKNDRTRHIEGSGLGLSIVRKVAGMYGGEVTVESEPGVGSTFRVRLAAPAAGPG